MNAIAWLVTALALTGNVFIIHRNPWGFACWAVSNVYLCGRNYYLGEFAQATLFFVYFWLAVWGVWKWKRATSIAQ